MTERHALTPFALVLLKKGNSILLAKRQNTGFADGFYSLIGGKVEAQETFRKALIREVFEEIGIRLKEDDLTCVHFFQRQGTETELVAAIFVATTWQGEPYNKESAKHNEIKWFDLAELPENIIPAHKQALDLIQKGELYSEHNY
jgi:8-oxo-dGTP diphosphatase